MAIPTLSDVPMTSSDFDSEPKTPTESVRGDAINALRGLGMGAADVVPGISGGTVALILGIYGRLVTAISRFDLTLLKRLRHGDLRGAARHVDLRFLVSLAVGVGTGILSMTMLTNSLLKSDLTRSLTMAAFFGMIAASGYLVTTMIQRTRPLWSLVAMGIGGAAAAWWLTTLTANTATDPSHAYLFLCGSIAICAMILPGISGAMILLMMGVYVHVTDLIKELPGQVLHGEPVGEALLTLTIFGSGCAISLLAFSRLLRWLLAHQAAATMSVLCGFIFGALPKIWPFQTDLTPEITELKHKLFETRWPDWFRGESWLIALTAVVAFAAVFAIDRFVRRKESGQSDAS